MKPGIKLAAALAVVAALGAGIVGTHTSSPPADNTRHIGQTDQNPFRYLRTATPEQAAALPQSQGFELK